MSAPVSGNIGGSAPVSSTTGGSAPVSSNTGGSAPELGTTGVSAPVSGSTGNRTQYYNFVFEPCYIGREPEETRTESEESYSSSNQFAQFLDSSVNIY